MPPTVRYGRQVVAAAIEARQQYAAERAVDDPAKLTMAARIVRLALAQGLITPGELGILAAKSGKRS